MSYDNLLIMHSFFVGVLKNVNKKDEKKIQFSTCPFGCMNGNGNRKMIM